MNFNELLEYIESRELIELKKMDTMALLALGAATAAIFSYLRRKWRLRGMPPGPRGVPFIGNGPQMDPTQPHKKFTEWGKDFGGLYTVNFLNKPVVVACSYETIREILVTRSTEFAGRPVSFRMHFLNHFDSDNFSFGDYSGRLARLKKMAQTSMKMYGDGLMKLEEISMEIIQETMDKMEQQKGKAFNPRYVLRQATANIITSMVSGDKMSKNDLELFLSKEPEAKRLLNPVGKGMELDLMPWLRFLPNATYRRLQVLQRDYGYLFQKMVNSRMDHFQDSDSSCFLDGILKRKDRGEVDADGKLLFTDQNVMVMVQDITLAGMATTAAAIYSILALCTIRPELQKRIQDEIEDAIGERPPTLGDRKALPYTEACIVEILRYLSQVPTLLPHKTIQDTTLGGYRIPKGTQILANVWALHHDEDFWEQPYEFKPERYLDEDGTLVGPDHPKRCRTLPFGAGRRVCFGETLARNRLFLFVASLLQKFNFTAVEGAPPRVDPREFPLQFILQPFDYELYAVPRK